MIFDNTILLSDIDGTLSGYDRKIVPANRDAIRYYTQNGGRFGVATGRTAHSAKRMIADIDVNCPCLVVNGGGIYDPARDEMLFACYLDHAAARLFNAVTDQVPGVGIEINNNGVLQCIRYSDRSREHIMYECGEFTQYTLADLPDDSRWFKALFTGKPEEIDRVEAICHELVTDRDPYYVIRSEPTLFEVLPTEANKGKSLVRLARMLSVPIENVFAIGDYYNDIDLLAAAGCSAAVGGAPQAVCAVTDYVTCPCQDGAVADFIAYIEQTINRR